MFGRIGGQKLASIKTIKDDLAAAKEVYHLVERGICGPYEFEDSITSIRTNIENTSFPFVDKELIRIEKIRGGIIEAATQVTEFYEYFRKLESVISKIQDTLIAYGMTEESDYLSMLISSEYHGIQSEEQLKIIIDEANWQISKLVAAGAFYDYRPIECGHIIHIYRDSRMAYERLKLHLLEYIDILQHHQNRFDEF